MFPSISSLFRSPHSTSQLDQYSNGPQESSKTSGPRQGFMAKFSRKERRDLLSNPISGISHTLRPRAANKQRAEKLEIRALTSIVASNTHEAPTHLSTANELNVRSLGHNMGQVYPLAQENIENPSSARRGNFNDAQDKPSVLQRIRQHRRNVQALNAPHLRPSTRRQHARPVCGENDVTSDASTPIAIATSNPSNDPLLPSRLSACHFDLPMSPAASDVDHDIHISDEAPALRVANSLTSPQTGSYYSWQLHASRVACDEDIQMAEAVEAPKFGWDDAPVAPRFDSNVSTLELLDDMSEVDAYLPTSAAVATVASSNTPKNKVVDVFPPQYNTTVAAVATTQHVVYPDVASTGAPNTTYLSGYSPTRTEDRPAHAAHASSAVPAKSSPCAFSSKYDPFAGATSFVFGRESDKVHYAKASEATQVWGADRHTTRTSTRTSTRARANPYALTSRATWKACKNKKDREVEIGGIVPILQPVSNIRGHDDARNVLMTMLQATGMADDDQLADVVEQVGNLSVDERTVDDDYDDGDDADAEGDTDDEADEDGGDAGKASAQAPASVDEATVLDFLNDIVAGIEREEKPYNMATLADSLDS